MSRSWGTLPIEILSIIFSNFNDLANEVQCQYVCKGWLLPAQIQRFKLVELYSYNVVSFVEAMEESANQVGKYIQSLELNEGRETDAWRSIIDIFSRLALFCPNVKVFKTKDMPDELWPKLLEVVQMGYWVNLQLMPSPDNIFNLDYYTDIVLKCRKLESITLLLWTNLSEVNEKYVKKLAENLNSFEFLKNLNIQTFAIISDLSDIESISKIEDCPSLKSISLYATYPSIVFTTSNETIDLEEINATPNILSFDGRIAISENSLKYLPHKFPGLNKLTLTLVVGRFFSLQPNQGTTTNREIAIDQFFEYISKIRKTTLSFTATQNPSNLIARYFRSPNNYHKKFKIIFGVLPPQQQPYPNILIETNCKADTVIWGEKSIVTEISILKPIVLGETTEDLPSLEVTKYIGVNIKMLHVSSPNRTSRTPYMLAIEKNLKEAIRRCVSLKTLILTNLSLLNVDNVQNQSLEKVVFDIDLIEKRETIIGSTSLPTLKYISVFSNIVRGKYTGFNYCFNIELPSNDVENVSWNTTKKMGGTASKTEFPRIYLWVSYSNRSDEFFIHSSSGLRKANELDFKYFRQSADYIDSENRCCVRVVCKSLKSFTFDTKPSSTYFPTTYLLEKYN